MYLQGGPCAAAWLRRGGAWLLQKDEFLRLIINSIRNDLISRNEAFQCLALGFVGNGAVIAARLHVFSALPQMLVD
jgi:hypothetical protein